MNTKKKIAFLSILMASTVGFSIEGTAQTNDSLEASTIEENQRIDKIKDFKEDRDKAEEWAKIAYEKWDKELKKEEKKSFDVLKNPIDNQEEVYDINEALRFWGGDVTKRPIGGEEKTNSYLKDIENIKTALARKAAKLDSSLYVYTNDNLDHIAGMDENFFKNENGTLNREKFKEFKSFYSGGVNSEFTIYDIAEVPSKDAGIVKWKIKLPKGTAAGHSGDNQLVVNNEMGLEITDMRVIVQKGKECIRIEANAVPKEKIDKKNEETARNINRDIVKLLDLPIESKLFELRLSGLDSSLVAEQSRELIRDFASQVDNKIIQNVTKFMFEKNGKIILADVSPAAIRESIFPLEPTENNLREVITAGGLFNNQNRTIILDARNSFKNGAKLDSGDLIHEFGHATDYYAGNLIYPGKNVTISDSQGFMKIFNEEKNNLTEYGKTNSHEFWAEAFRLMNSKKTEDIKFVQENAPKTYEFIKKVLSNLKV